MTKDTPFRLCLIFLLVMQTICWALALLDLFSPGKPLSLYRSSMSIYRNSTTMLSQLLSRRAAAAGWLSYRDLRTRF
ncbi:uncharacterized protein EI97DRAFT_429971 [Westerdykella ornata]|uniref:Uncharacterized protein n=1 Tax=Westerdykella ornata TaxID=318751 RepID=A0A6A6JVG1_WESOR|nr:uncharacterized protein EI97DRAFT_429971 [Westerdykella ornata]KAF2280214.1 hypothetical protein EI97DRAFT_429971 [Westerdykella ornata]